MRSSAISKPAFEELSPDLRWKLAAKAERQDWLITGVCSLITGAMLLPVAVPQLNRLADGAIAIALGTAQTMDLITGTVSPDYNDPVQKGENVAGYVVTSGYGWRDTTNLPAGASEDHKGVDLATPNGEPLHAVGEPGTKVKVECWTDNGGGGLVAEIAPESMPGMRFQALHLSECKTGVWSAGDAIAFTGDTGIGAPHLDWRQRDKATGQHQHPQKGYLLWALTGRKPRSPSSEQLADSIKEDEGLRLNAYLDPVGVPTIGWGTTVYPDGRKVQLGDTITERQAEEYLQHDINAAQKSVTETIQKPLNQNELDALTSFEYNTGAIQDSTLADKLNAGDKKGAAAELDRWVHGTVGNQKVVLPGLVKRREREKTLFLED